MKETNTYHEGMGDLNLPESLRVNPFSIPPDYFEGLTARTNAYALFAHSDPAQPSFEVPANYFVNLSETILAQVKLAKGNTLQENAGMDLPPNYFEALRTSILAQKNLADLQEPAAQTVPVNYFETLNNQIQHRIQEEKLKDKVAVTGFTTAEGYFETLTTSITAKTKAEAKVINFPQRGFQRWIQYAAAACVTTILSVGSYYAVSTKDQPALQQEQLATVSDAEILNYLAYSMDSNDLMYVMEAIYQPSDEEEVVKHVDKDDIKDYLKYML